MSTSILQRAQECLTRRSNAGGGGGGDASMSSASAAAGAAAAAAGGGGVCKAIEMAIIGAFPKHPAADLLDLAEFGCGVPVAIVYFIILGFCLVFFSVIDAQKQMKAEFLSASINTTGAICDYVPYPITATFLGDMNGHWETNVNQFQFNESLYAIKFLGTRINRRQYNDAMGVFSTKVANLAKKVEQRDMAYAYLALSTYKAVNTTYGLSFYLNARSDIIFNQQIASTQFTNRFGVCVQNNIRSSFDSATGRVVISVPTVYQPYTDSSNVQIFDAPSVAPTKLITSVPTTNIGPTTSPTFSSPSKAAAYIASQTSAPTPTSYVSPATDDASMPFTAESDRPTIQNYDPCPTHFSTFQNFNYLNSKDMSNTMNLGIDVRSITTATAANYGLVGTDSLAQINLQHSKFSGGLYYIDPLYAPMDPIFCMDVPAGTPAVCFVSFGNVLFYPVISSYGPNEGKEPKPCVCPKDATNSNCNEFDILVGLIFWKDDLIDTSYVWSPENSYTFAFGLQMQAKVIAAGGRAKKGKSSQPSSSKANKGDLELIKFLYPVLENSMAVSRTITSKSMTLFWDAVLEGQFLDMCPGNCTMLSMEFVGSPKFNPINDADLQLEEINTSNEAIDVSASGTSYYAPKTGNTCCHNSVYISTALASLSAIPPIKLVNDYYRCHLEPTVAIQRAIGVAQGQATLYAGLCATFLITVIVQYLNRRAIKDEDKKIKSLQAKELQAKLEADLAHNIVQKVLDAVLKHSNIPDKEALIAEFDEVYSKTVKSEEELMQSDAYKMREKPTPVVVAAPANSSLQARYAVALSDNEEGELEEGKQKAKKESVENKETKSKPAQKGSLQGEDPF